MIEILIIVLTNAFIFLPNLRCGLIVDDVKHSLDVQGGILVGTSFLDSVRRRLYGVGTLSVGGNINLKREYLFGVILNITVGLLIYFAFRRVSGDEIALFSSLLYSANPINNQTSIWLNGRRYVVNIILVLLMMIVGPIGLFFWLLTPAFQVNALFAPVLLGGYYWALIPLAFLVGRPMIDKFKTRSTLQPYHERNTTHPRRLIVMIKSFGWYIRKMLWPGRCLFVYRFLHYWGMTSTGNKSAYSLDLSFWWGVLCVVGFGVVGVLLPLYLLPLWVFLFLSVAQWCNVVTITQTLADRYASLANVFMMFFLVFFIWETCGIYWWMVIGALLGVYASGLYRVREQYIDVEHMYNYQIYYDKEGVSARSFMASDLIKIGDTLSAWEVVKQGIRYNPTDFKMLYQGALCLFLLDKEKNRGEIVSLLDRAEANIYDGGDGKLQELVSKLRGAL